jgi:hypothetical protein
MLSPEDRKNIVLEGRPRDLATMVRLDDWAKSERIERCDFIKIDIEGAELLAFRGGIETLRKCRPIILGEFSPYWMAQIGQSFADVAAFFNVLDYCYYREINGVFQPLTEDILATGLETPSYLLVPREKDCVSDWNRY